MTRLEAERPRTTRRLMLGGMVGLAFLVAACSSSASPTTTTSSAKRLSGSITVSAASSLTGAFGEMGKRFEAAHHGTTIVFNFGSSSTLAAQILSGAPADVYASAGTMVMSSLATAGRLAGKPVIFARNSLEIAVKPGNPLGIRTLADLRRAAVVALCTPSAPCGAAAQMALKRTGVELPVTKVTLGADVKSTLEQVASGDADAAIVYVTDVKAAKTAVTGVVIPASQNVVSSYSIAVVKGTTNAVLARAWINYVLSPEGQHALRGAGFLSPR